MTSSSLSMSREKAEEICKHIKENSGALFGQKFWECRLACALLAQQKGDRWESRFMAIAKFRVFILQGKSVNSLKIEKCFNIVALRYLELLQQDLQLQIGWEERSAKPSSSAAGAVPPMLHFLVRFPENDLVNNTNSKSNEDDGMEQELQHNQPQQQRCRTVRELAMHLLATLKHYFPDIQRSLAKHFLTISPSLIADFSALPSSTPELPCHNFRRSYVAHCDWLEHPFRDEVIWDIERIYFVHSQHELDLNDFNHLPAKDLQALIGAVQFSDFFTGISATAQRLQPEHVDALLALVRRSHSLRSLRLCRCTVPKDFVAQFAAALALNASLPLERLRLGELTIEDRKGLAQLGTMLPQLPALHTLFLTDCALNEKLALCLLHALHHGIELAAADNGGGNGLNSAMASSSSKSNSKQRQSLHSSPSASSGAVPATFASQRFQLRALNLSGNQLGNGTELAEQLANLVALSGGAMRLLDLGGTAVQLDRLWSALKLGGFGLEVLRLGGCYCSPSSSKRSGGSAKDSAQVTRELFTAVHSLRELNLSGTHVGPELLQGILDGLSANPHLSPGSLHLCLDSAIVGSAACVSVLEQHIGDCACVGSLSLRDNALEHEAFRLLSALGRACHLRVLDIGGANFFSLRAAKKHAPVLAGILAELVKLVNGIEREGQGEAAEEGGGPFIAELSLADARLGPHLSVFLNALGLCGRLKRLDLSNNELGPAGARLLCKSLQLNHALRWLALDRNQIGPDGFAELARALRVNVSLDGLQMPFSDAAECVVAMARMPAERARFQLQMEEIEQCLERNRQLHTFSSSIEPPVALCHFVQKTMHKLNNYCELYGLDECGHDAELKKIAFHKIGKMITKKGHNFGTPNNADCDDENNSGAKSNVGGRHADNGRGILETLADQLAERIERFTDLHSERFVQQFIFRLADLEDVQMQPEHRQAEIDQQKCETNKRLGVALRDDLAALLDKYKKEFAWSHLFANVHQCLLAEDAQEMFMVQQHANSDPSSSSSSTRTRKREVVFRGNNQSQQNGATHQSQHRPESAIVPTEDARTTAADAMASLLLMSRSVIGDFTHATDDNQPGGEGDNGSSNGKLLTHLAKQRPKPARLNRSRIQPTTATGTSPTVDDEQQQCVDGSPPTSSSTANGHFASTESVSDSPLTAAASSPATAHCANPNNSSPCYMGNDMGLPPSPLPLRVRPTPSSPPVVPPRRERMGDGPDSPLTPPKLPPKPPPSPAGRQIEEGQTKGRDGDDDDGSEKMKK
ncbi:hypothetical protein niasHS_009347 [Heterodera schachtii]|uniref:Uncharacterized protein n=1 Tax=Heterodera schachtii TaxID=97005 RepID=A0ABD2JBS8_HETSC